MKIQRAAALAAVVMLSPDLAQAAGTITGLSASPPSPAVSQDVVVTVEGLLGCGGVDVDFGDNTPQAHLQNVSFKNKLNVSAPAHKYASAKTYSVKALPGAGCQGQATLPLTVKSSATLGGNLLGTPGLICAILGNCGTPTISNLFLAPITPGGKLLALGSNFGNAGPQNQFHLFLKTDQKDVLLAIDEWKNTYVAGTIPASLTQVLDQPAELYVKAGNGKLSNKYPVSFTAARELKMIPYPDVTVASCATDSNCDQCNTHLDPDDADQWCLVVIYGNTSVQGSKHNNWAAIGDDSGSDTYQVSLKNGWICDHLGPLQGIVDPGEGWTKGPWLFASGASTCKVQIDWLVTPDDSLFYDLPIFVKGPKGTSWK